MFIIIVLLRNRIAKVIPIRATSVPRLDIFRGRLGISYPTPTLWTTHNHRMPTMDETHRWRMLDNEVASGIAGSANNSQGRICHHRLQSGERSGLIATSHRGVERQLDRFAPRAKARRVQDDDPPAPQPSRTCGKDFEPAMTTTSSLTSLHHLHSRPLTTTMLLSHECLIYRQERGA